LAYEQKDLSGSLFINDRKDKDTHPDRTGTALIDGVEYWVSGWVKKKQDGTPWMSLAFKRKEAKRGAPPPSPRPQRRDDPISSGRPNADMDDEIPF
jgi:hypothetical protein